jgi:hypothetical protein
MLDKTSLILKPRRHLMSIKVRILKDKSVSSGRDIMDLTRDGELSTKTNQPRKEPLDLIRTLDSTS